MNLTCIICPRGCSLSIDESTLEVSGNTCKRGEVYAKQELTHPMRTITSTVKIKNALYARLPVITSKPVEKEKIFEIMEEINKIEVIAPVKCNDVLLSNPCGTDCDILASRSMESLVTDK